MTEQQLIANVDTATQQLVAAKLALERFRSTIDYHTYDTLDEALSSLEDLLYNKANADCEGSYNFGDESYTQEFRVDGVDYVATMTFEYNRHDKTYYYIDGSEFTYVKKEKNES